MSTGSVRIRSRLTNNKTHLDLLLSHPMESGLRKDKNNNAIPAWYLTEVEIFRNDDSVTSIQVGLVMSRNPAISVVLQGGVEGDVIAVRWHDSRGKSGESRSKVG